MSIGVTVRVWVAMVLAAVMMGCQSSRSVPLARLNRGQFSEVRVALQKQLRDKREGNYLLDRERLAIVTMADGYPHVAQSTFEEIYDFLRTQGINRDKTVASVVIHEGVKTWKGEPFEQAMAFIYYSFQQASLGYWDNARAAANNSLFNLRDFSGDSGRKMNVEDVAREALKRERQSGDSDAGEEFINSGYAVRESNFTLGYIMAGIANQQLGRDEEANDHFAVAAEIEPTIRPLLRELRDGRYNTVLIVSYGMGPVKTAYGEDEARVGFFPRSPSDDRPLVVRISGDDRRHHYPIITDLNVMARDHIWNSLENVRLAKSSLGTLFTVGGSMAAFAGAAGGNDTAVYAGLGALVAGLAMKASASADTRYLEVLPQRIYLVPIRIEQENTTVELQVRNEDGSRLVLAGLKPPPPGVGAQLRYVRLLHDVREAPSWAVSGRIYYANPSTGPTTEPATPYILGGNCVRPPSEAVLSEYKAAGVLDDYTLGDLMELYRAEGITWEAIGPVGKHVLEGGRSLVAPLEGTTGFARLFGQVHRGYRPRSEVVRKVLEGIQRE